MKIAFLVGGFPRTTETFILNQVTGLIDLGHEVDIYAKRRHQDTAVHDEVYRYKLIERTHYFDIPEDRLRRLARVVQCFLSAGLRRAPTLLRCANVRRYGSLYAAMNNVVYAVPFLRKRYDVVMCHYGTNGVDFIFLKNVLPELRFVTMFHAGDIRLGEERGAAVYDALCRHGDLFLAISDCYNRRKLVEFGFDNARIVTHRIGVDLEQISYKPKVTQPGVIRLLTVARLDPEKGLEHAIRAVASYAQRHTTLTIDYRLIGDGALRERLTALVAELGLEESVHLVGPQSTAEVVKAMHACDVFLLPSLAEATPTVLLEAQATGTPFIATNVNGVPEIVADQESGLLVPPADSRAIEAALERLAEQPALRERMGRTGRAFVEQHHDIRTLDRRLADIFSQLLCQNSAAHALKNAAPHPVH